MKPFAVTSAAPGICAIFSTNARGTAPPKRAPENMRSARASSCTLSKVAFMPMVSPNRVKAIITDKRVRSARTGFRTIAAQTRGRYLMPSPLCGSESALDQLALVHLQLAAGMVGGLGIVGNHQDGLAVLAVELLQQRQDFVRR